MRLISHLTPGGAGKALVPGGARPPGKDTAGASRDGGRERAAGGPRAGADQRVPEPHHMGAVEFKQGEERVS